MSVKIFDVRGRLADIFDKKKQDLLISGPAIALGTGLVPDTKFPDMGKVTPTEPPSMQVLVQDYFGLILGTPVGNRVWNKKKKFRVNIDPPDITNSRIDLICISAEKYPKVLKEGETEEDIADYFKSETGTIVVLKGTPSTDPKPVYVPEIQSPYIVLAQIRVNPGITAITQDDITDVRDWLLRIEQMNKDLTDYIDQEVAKAKRELYQFILDQWTPVIQDEIAAGDNAVRTELDTKVTDLQNQINDLSVAIETIRQSLSDLLLYVTEHITNLTTKTAELEQWILNLQNIVDENTAFLSALNTKVNQALADIFLEKLRLDTLEQRVNGLELEGGKQAANEIYKLLLIEIAKTNFQINLLHSRAAFRLRNGWVDIFQDTGNIDPALSSQWEHDAGYRKILPARYLSISEPRLDENWMTYPLNAPLSNYPDLWTAYSDLYAYVGEEQGRRCLKSPYWTGYFRRIGLQLIVGLIEFDAFMKTNHWSSSFRFFLRAGGYPGGYTDLYPMWEVYIYPYSASVYDMSSPWGGYGKGSAYFTPVLNKWVNWKIELTADRRVKIYRDDVLVYTSDQCGDYTVGNVWFSCYSNALFGAVKVGGSIWLRHDTATIVSKPATAEGANDNVITIVKDNDKVSYEASRDNGLTWTPITKTELVSIAAQPTGNQMRLKAILNGSDAELDDWSFWWK
ncbi:MAG: hypothetical protein AB1349_01490 [Elusimicrobiota bacterium]